MNLWCFVWSYVINSAGMENVILADINYYTTYRMTTASSFCVFSCVANKCLDYIVSFCLMTAVRCSRKSGEEL